MSLLLDLLLGSRYSLTNAWLQARRSLVASDNPWYPPVALKPVTKQSVASLFANLIRTLAVADNPEPMRSNRLRPSDRTTNEWIHHARRNDGIRYASADT
jgi:hypothetical protein